MPFIPHPYDTVLYSKRPALTSENYRRACELYAEIEEKNPSWSIDDILDEVENKIAEKI